MIGQTFRQESNKQFGKDQSYLCANRLSETHQNYAFGIFSDAILSKTTTAQLQTQKIQVRWQQIYKEPLSNISNFTCLLIKLSTTPVGCCGCLAKDRKIYPKQEEATGQFTAAFSSDIFTQPTRFPSCCEQPKASRRALLNLAEKKGCSRAALTSSGHVMGPSARRLMALFRYTVVAPLDLDSTFSVWFS